MSDDRFCFIVICEKKPTWVGNLFVKKEPSHTLAVHYCDDHARDQTKRAAESGTLRLVLTPMPKPEFDKPKTQSPDRFKRGDIVKDEKGNHFLVTAVKGMKCNVESVVTKERWVGRQRSEFFKTDRVAM